MFKLLSSAFKRLMTAITSPFRMIIVRIQRMFNINVLTAKLISPLTKKVKSLITLKPQTKDDYYVIGRHWIYKKLFMTIILVCCAGVLLYFSMFAPKLPATAPTVAAVTTDITYDYNDMKLREFTGVANIRAADGEIVYTGDLNAGVCKGVGTLKSRSGKLVYVGDFDKNRYNGKGISYYPSGNKRYEGGFVDNRYQGDGSLFANDGTLLYVGGFQNGLYSGAGKAYTKDGRLMYEGNFTDGLYHGVGTSYDENGIIRYKGEFFKGTPQGLGSLYNKVGKLLYTGDMFDGRINYRSLLYSNLADIRQAFAESPRVFYTDTDSAFVFEQAGVVVTTDCRVLVDTWEKPAAQNSSQGNYYMPNPTSPDAQIPSTSATPVPTPGGNPYLDPSIIPPEVFIVDEAAPLPTRTAAGGLPPLLAPADHVGTASPEIRSGLVARDNAPVLRKVEWYVGDSGQTPAPPSDSSSTVPPTPPSLNSDAPPLTNTPPEITQLPGEAKPDFVQKTHTLYFEIDTDIWQEESKLDKSKIPIKKITVFGTDIPAIAPNALEYQDDAPPSMEDCVAIDFIRQQMPTAFSHIIYEMDRVNRLFVRMWNINYADRINRRVYLLDDLTYRYCYQSSTDKTPLFFSIER